MLSPLAASTTMMVGALTGASGPAFFADEFDAFQLKVGAVTTFASSRSLTAHIFP
jgi:hypothetical protein